MTNYPRPPAHVAAYVEALGVETAVRFLLHFGGAELYIAADPKGNSEVAAVLGMDAARALSALAARAHLARRVPNAKPWLARYMKVTEGLSHAKIARRLHASDVSIRRWIAGLGDHAEADTAQLRLF